MNDDDRWQTQRVADHRVREDDRLASARDQARFHGPPPHTVALFSERMFTPNARESQQLGTVSGETALGLPPAPITVGRARPSDYDEEDYR